jgi:2-hydroxychromene-2-carboxylate isomerase
MAVTIDYFFSLISPWAYLGSERFQEMVRRHGARVAYKPVELGKVFAATGGVPLAKRGAARQAYRLTELARWRDFLSLPLHIQPRFFPADESLAARMVIAADRQGLDVGPMTSAILRGVWAEERDIADRCTLAQIAACCGFDADALLDAANGEEVGAEYARNTEEAIARNVFGSPTYAIGDVLFWGQDRLEFLERALARHAVG